MNLEECSRHCRPQFMKHVLPRLTRPIFFSVETIVYSRTHSSHDNIPQKLIGNVPVAILLWHYAIGLSINNEFKKFLKYRVHSLPEGQCLLFTAFQKVSVCCLQPSRRSVFVVYSIYILFYMYLVLFLWEREISEQQRYYALPLLQAPKSYQYKIVDEVFPQHLHGTVVIIITLIMKSTKVLTLSSVCKQNYCNC